MHETIKAEMVALVPRLRRFAYALTGSKPDGDDLVQTACIKALERLHQYRDGTRLDSWLFRIVQTTWLDTMRRTRRWDTRSDPEALDRLSDEGAAVRQSEDRLTLVRVRDAMDALPEDQRAVIALVAIEGASYAETAAILSIPVGTVMSRLARARARLMASTKDTTP
ncbi:MAG: sigma-70 family RNA polymerase sigma factor [Alphaproteobacteria bacterium]|nr:sigma-70 family RNA polymerase sigma factor [Alphaproteobacteria bacterium]